MSTNNSSSGFVVCIDNTDYEVSLHLHKIYPVLENARAANDVLIRVIEESGEDYLFSSERFIAIEVPEALRQSLLAKAS